MRSDLDPQKLRLLVVGDVRSRRTTLLAEAAARHDFDVIVISYADFLTRCHDRDWIRPGTFVRIESPGDDKETTRLILKSGIVSMERMHRVPITATEIDARSFERGEVLHPRQWFLGFKDILQQMEFLWSHQGIRWMNSPESIVTSFDKQSCLDRWVEAGLPTAPGYREIQTYSQLRGVVAERHRRLFIKPRYGYSAIGAMALEWRDHLVRAITTVDVTWDSGRPRLFVTKRPRVLQREFEIAWLIDTLAMEEIVVEDWLPKARWNSVPFDLRVVTIGGRAQHVVGRANHSPFTNLNLDARRIERDDIETHLGEAWTHVLALAEHAAARISTGYLGMDLLVRPCRRQCVVLEANAFGDYLPGLLFQGETTYDTEMRLCGAVGKLQ